MLGFVSVSFVGKNMASKLSCTVAYMDLNARCHFPQASLWEAIGPEDCTRWIIILFLSCRESIALEGHRWTTSPFSPFRKAYI